MWSTIRKMAPGCHKIAGPSHWKSSHSIFKRRDTRDYITIWYFRTERKPVTRHFQQRQSDHESLPDASDIDTNTTISEILKEIAAESLVIKEMELRLIKANKECNFRSRQIDELRSLLKKPGTDSTTVLNRIDTLSVLLHESESDCNALIEQINELKSLLKESGRDSIAPLE